MDFGQLLSVAQKNRVTKQNVSYYPSKFTPPKKESKQSKALSDNIKRFLAKKEEEERQKALIEKKKKENLLALRDHKAQSRINKHLKVCKAANKAVLADAINHEDTAVTMAGPSQPDEDDYGYTSQEASAFYNKLMSKYNNLPPEKPLFSDSGKKVVKDIASTKDRVKQALKQQELEESLPHRRKRKSSGAPDKDEPREKESNVDRDKTERAEKCSDRERDEKSKSKKRPPGPPPMDFVSLLKLAEQKQYEPVVIEPKPKPKPEESERLMTKRQMKEYQKEREWREKREREKNGEVVKPASEAKPPKVVPNRIPKLNGKAPSAIPEKAPPKPPPQPKRVPERPPEKPPTPAPKPSARDEILEERKKLEAEKRELEAMRRKIEEEKRQLALSKAKPEDKNKAVKANGKIDKPSVSPQNVKPRQFSPADVKPRQFPPADVQPRQFPPADVRRAPTRPMKNGRPMPVNKRRIYDDDDEYDSELDDFIDDGPEEHGEDYSKYISEIFGYDKSKYSNCEDDDDNMESSFAQQLKEEFVSSKIGYLEDLEDMKMEALEKKRKAMLKKKLQKKS